MAIIGITLAFHNINVAERMIQLGCPFGASMVGCGISGLHGWLGFVMAALLLLAVIGIAVRALASFRRRADSRDSLAILKRRLAAGEINIEEFETLCKYI